MSGSAPASITKVMSLLLVVESIESGGLTSDTLCASASEHACSMGGSQIWLEPGETMTVDEFKASVIGSKRCDCKSWRSHSRKRRKAFVAMMNEKVYQLGMEDTCFKKCDRT